MGAVAGGGVLDGGRVMGGRVETLPYGYWERRPGQPGSTVPVGRIGLKPDPCICPHAAWDQCRLVNVGTGSVALLPAALLAQASGVTGVGVALLAQASACAAPVGSVRFQPSG